MNAIDDYVSSLVSSCPTIREVWLIGSRANATAKTTSDWDLLVFSDPHSMQCLRENAALHREDVDCLVVVDGDNFENAWGREKTGSLRTWKWKRVNEVRATYLEAKWREGEDCMSVVSTERYAKRLWPAP